MPVRGDEKRFGSARLAESLGGVLDRIDTLPLESPADAHYADIHGWVVLPDHLHCVIELPAHEADFATRWRLIKMGFSKALPPLEWRSKVRIDRGERGIWQRRCWEHLICDEADFRTHMDYVHINPVKHGWVERVCNWPHSTFHRLVEQGVYPPDWAGEAATALGYSD